MDRWWSDKHDSIAALARVDSTDVVQGVGTAVLGYHGLAEAILRPLSVKTLVDGQMVHDALHGIDLEPVAKAMANATRPVIGDSAERYGYLLAQSLHQDAVDSTTAFMTNLVSGGMPWPTAIERAASVHGVPMSRLGKANVSLRAPALSKLVQADVCDRALMDYAAYVGKREDTRETVHKSGLYRRWDEEQVKRDPEGRFANEGGNSLSGLQERNAGDAKKAAQLSRARKERKSRKRVQAAEARNSTTSLASIIAANSPQSSQRTPVSAQSLQRLTQEEKTDRLQVLIDARKEKILDTKTNTMREAKIAKLINALANRIKNVAPFEDDLMGSPDEHVRDDEGYLQGWLAGSDSEQLFMLASKTILTQASQQGKFNMGALHQANGVTEMELFNRDELRQAVLDYSYTSADSFEDLAILAIDGEVAWDEKFTFGYEALPAMGGDYHVTHRNRHGGDLEYDDYLDMNLRMYAAPGSSKGIQVPLTLPNLTVILSNEKEFRRMPGGRVRKQWREDSVRRDDEGKFSVKASSGEQSATRRSLSERELNMRRKKIKAMKREKAMQARLDWQSASARGFINAAPRASSMVNNNNSSASTFLVQDAQNNQGSVTDQRVDSLVAARKDKIMARKMENIRAQIADRTEVLDDFRFAHEGWKELKGARFTEEGDRATFMAVFNYDPYSDTKANDFYDIDEGERLDAIDSFRVRPSEDLVERMNNESTSYLGNPEEVDNGALSSTAVNALAIAQAEADTRNSNSDSATSKWMPMVAYNSEQKDFPFFTSFVVEVGKIDEDVVVLGSDLDWAALKSGANVELEPLPGFDSDADQPGQGTFDELFYAVGSDESIKRYVDTRERSDYYVRAFRIKMQHNKH